MKRNIVLVFALSIFSTAQLFPSDAGKVHRKAGCCGLDTLVYKATSKIGRNDYLYLAHANYAWYLKKKIELKENIEDVDRYYLRYVNGVNDVVLSTYRTPLHEAIVCGHVEAVKTLCAAGAEKTKKIVRSASDNMAQESKGLSVFHFYQCGLSKQESKKQIERLEKEDDIGFSAVELAKKLHEEGVDSDYYTSSADVVERYKQDRKAIYDLLKKKD